VLALTAHKLQATVNNNHAQGVGSCSSREVADNVCVCSHSRIVSTAHVVFSELRTMLRIIVSTARTLQHMTIERCSPSAYNRHQLPHKSAAKRLIIALVTYVEVVHIVLVKSISSVQRCCYVNSSAIRLQLSPFTRFCERPVPLEASVTITVHAVSTSTSLKLTVFAALLLQLLLQLLLLLLLVALVMLLAVYQLL
jgi:hypothetical protein